MTDKIFIKEKPDGIWGKHPKIMFGSVIILMSFGILAEEIMSVFWGISRFALRSSIIGVLVLGIYYVVYMINKCYQSRFVGFLFRDNKLYAVKLLYTNELLGTETNTVFNYSNGDSTSLGNNIDIAINTYVHDKELEKRSSKKEAFSVALDDIFSTLSADASLYRVKSDRQAPVKRFLETLLIYNSPMVYVNGKKAEYEFLWLRNPEIVKKNNKYIVVAFENECGEKCTIRFVNCYGAILDYI